MLVSVGYGFGNLYSIRHGAYSVVIAALDSIHARKAFVSFLADRGETVAPSAFRVLKTQSIGARTLLVALPNYSGRIHEGGN